MLTYPIGALLLGSSFSVTALAKAAGGSRRNKAHHRKLPNQKEFEKDLYGNSESSAALRKKFIAKSTFVGGRELQNNGYYNNNGYNNNYEGAEQANGDAAGGYYRYDENGNRVYYNAYGYGYGSAFNPSNYALSYHRCAAVKQFDVEVAADEDAENVFVTKHFAVFRFCPVDTCDAQYSQGNGAGGEANEYQDQYENGGNEGRRLEDAEEEEEEEEENDDDDGDDADEEEDNGENNENAYKWKKDNKVYGARGSGCKRNYGEYMIELEDYLQIMMEHQQERIEQYCEFCQNYMYNVYMQNYGYNYGNNRKLSFEEFKNDPAAHRELGGDDGDDGDDGDYSKCSQYIYVCNGDGDNGEEEYMQCSEGGNDDGLFIGPHCAEDGFTITLGNYADEDCDEYVGGEVYISDDDDDGNNGNGYDLVNYYNSRHGSLSVLYEGQESSMCIPCNEDYEFAYDDGNNNNNNNGNNNGDNNGDNNGNNNGNNNGEMSPLCQQLYEASAHCERHYKTFKKSYLTDQQWENMELSCDYIDSIVMGNYDEAGYVNFKWTWGLWGNNKQGNNIYASKYSSVTTSVSPLQVFFLVFTILACVILAVWSKTLHTSLTKKEPWSPRADRWNVNNIFRRSQEKPQQPDISPADSGIGASRVRSDGTSYYLT